MKDPDVLRRFALANWFCALCGREWYGLHTQTIHHIADGGARSDEPCNLLCLGWCPCHMLDKEQVVVGEVKLPMLTTGQQLFLKRRANPLEWNPERLAVLIGRPLPDLEEPPAWAQSIFRCCRPEFFV